MTEPPVRRTPAPRAERAQPAFDDAPRPRAQVAPARRTVTIRGQGAERYVPARDQGRRRFERRYESPGFRPDRAAMWAVLLCILMIVIAAASAHAATLHALTSLH